MDQLKMAWNEPGSNSNNDNKSSNDKNSNNKQSNQNGPPDLEAIFSNLRKHFLSLFGFKASNQNINNSKFNNFKDNNKIIFFIIAVVGIIYLLIGLYIVNPAEQAVITRFGKFNRIVGPGPHWLPRFIEVKNIVNSEQIGSSKHSASMLTKDENIIFVEIEVQYKISDVNNYLFKVSEPIKTLKQAVESALRQVIGHANLDFIMTEGRAQISEDIQHQLSLILDQYNAGIQIITVAFKEAKAPEAVKSAFDDVIKAREEQERLKHAAEAFANKIVPEAKGDAQRMLVEAQSYKQEIIAKAIGDTLRFNAILLEYNKAPEITRKRLYIDTIEQILSNSSKIIVDVKQANNLMYLPIDKFIAGSAASSNLSDSKGEIVNDTTQQ